MKVALKTHDKQPLQKRKGPAELLTTEVCQLKVHFGLGSLRLTLKTAHDWEFLLTGYFEDHPSYFGEPSWPGGYPFVAKSQHCPTICCLARGLRRLVPFDRQTEFDFLILKFSFELCGPHKAKLKTTLNIVWSRLASYNNLTNTTTQVPCKLWLTVCKIKQFFKLAGSSNGLPQSVGERIGKWLTNKKMLADTTEFTMYFTIYNCTSHTCHPLQPLWCVY